MADKYGKTYHVRLPKDLHDRFERVYANYRGLAPSVVLRMIVNHCLTQKTDEQLAEIIENAIRGEPPSGKRAADQKTLNRLSMNTPSRKGDAT